MRKSVLIIAVFIGALLNAKSTIAQTMFYKDTFYSAPFQRLVGATPVNLGNDTIWDDPNYSVPLGFKFRIFNDSTNTIYSNSDFNLGAIFSDKDATASFPTFIFSSLLDLENKSSLNYTSPISYQISGTAPNRIGKIEIRNAGLFDGLATDSLDIQVWFYEGSDVLEYRYGNVNIQAQLQDVYSISGGFGDFIGIMDSVDVLGAIPSAKKTYFLQNSPQNPTLDSLATFNFASGVLPGLDSSISSNSVIRFIPIKPIPVFPASIYNVNGEKNLQLYYDNSVLQITNTQANKITAILLDVNGAQLQTINLNSGINKIDIGNKPNGIYFLKVLNSRGLMEVYQIVKQ
jgi:hypothetical protein